MLEALYQIPRRHVIFISYGYTLTFIMETIGLERNDMEQEEFPLKKKTHCVGKSAKGTLSIEKHTRNFTHEENIIL